MTRISLTEAMRAARIRLTEAGVPSPQADVVALVAHLLGTTYGDVHRLAIMGESAPPGLDELVERRARRIPLQHLTGRAPFRGRELSVGPGVFVPRPETEVLVGGVVAEWESSAQHRAPIVVDLCTGSAAIAVALAEELPGARVWAVELSSEAVAYAARNIQDSGSGVTLVAGDASDPALAELAELDGTVDVVTCNPPYIPDGMVPIDPEVRDHDPELALYGRSADGLAVPLAMARRAAALLRPGGLLAMEHGDAQGESLPSALARQGFWERIRDQEDLAGRPRVTFARRH